jgi:hypothetical protein
MICVECMGEKNLHDHVIPYINMDTIYDYYCICIECACNPPNFDSLNSVH